MKSLTLTATLFLVAALVYASDAESCVNHNCQAAFKCNRVVDAACPNRGDSCCDYVKPDYRDQCIQHGGECVQHYCHPRLQPAPELTDCTGDTHCCVLVV